MPIVIPSIDAYNAIFHQPTLHPLVAVGNLAEAETRLFAPTDFNMYCIVLMDVDFGELVKDGHTHRYSAGTIFSLRPGQVVSMNLNYAVKPQGWMLVFEPELLEKTGLGRDFYMFSFFQHDVGEALNLSAEERAVILNCFANINAELRAPNDTLTNHIIRISIGQMLSYCKRYFERQYQERTERDNSLKQRLDTIIDHYLSSGSTAQQGQPTVAWCAEQMNLSPNYFGDLVKRELHVTAQDYIQEKITDSAKRLLSSSQMTISEIAQELGFAYPNHFTRMFRRRVGQTPGQWRDDRQQAPQP